MAAVAVNDVASSDMLLLAVSEEYSTLTEKRRTRQPPPPLIVPAKNLCFESMRPLSAGSAFLPVFRPTPFYPSPLSSVSTSPLSTESLFSDAITFQPTSAPPSPGIVIPLPSYIKNNHSSNISTTSLLSGSSTPDKATIPTESIPKPIFDVARAAATLFVEDASTTGASETSTNDKLKSLLKNWSSTAPLSVSSTSPSHVSMVKKTETNFKTDHRISKPKRSYHCEHDACGKSFETVTSLHRHKRVHSDERHYPCPICEQRFCTLSHQKRHIRVHTGERPFICQECKQNFSTCASLKRHQNLPFFCQVCFKRFSAFDGLKRHSIKHKSIGDDIAS